MEFIKYLSLYFYTFSIKYKIREETISNVLLGVGTGIIANVMFVLTTTNDYHIINLTISFIFAIIILLTGSIEKKGK